MKLQGKHRILEEESIMYGVVEWLQIWGLLLSLLSQAVICLYTNQIFHILHWVVVPGNINRQGQTPHI